PTPLSSTKRRGSGSGGAMGRRAEAAPDAGFEGAKDVLRVVSRRFGVLEVSEKRVLDFSEGLVGFPRERRIAVLEHGPGSPFCWLPSLADPELTSAAADPARIVHGYHVPTGEAASALGSQPSEVELLALVAIPSDPRHMTINLVAPIAIDWKRRVG